MTPADQTLLAERGEPGDCLRACVATILDLPIERVPHFTLEACRRCNVDVNRRPFPYHQVADGVGLRERRLLRRFLAEHGKRVIYPDRWEEVPGEGFAIGSGPAARGLRHAVVIHRDRFEATPRMDDAGVIDGYFLRYHLAHDPHPSRAGLLNLETVEFIMDAVH